MTYLSSRTMGHWLIGVCFVGWLTYLAIASVAPSRIQARFESDVEALENAQKALAILQARSGEYPTTRGRWVALPSEQWASSSEHPGKFDEMLRGAPVWEGTPAGAVVYMSDGKDYKLIWHKPDDCTGAHAGRPSLIDPVRTSYSRSMIPGGWTVSSQQEEAVAPARNPMVKPDPRIKNPLFGECWALGVWTPGAVFW